MKVTIQNLGPLKSAEISIKPLTVLVGPNNTGKTWLAYTLASIFTSSGYLNYALNREVNEEQPMHKFLKEVVRKVIDDGSASVDLVAFADKYGEDYFNDVAQCIIQYMQDFMGTRFSSFDGLHIKVELGETKDEFLKRVLNLGSKSGLGGKKRSFDLRKRSGSRRISISLYTQTIISDDGSSEELFDEGITGGVPSDFAADLMTSAIFSALHRSLYNHVRILPTERTTYIAFPFPGSEDRKTNSATEEVDSKNALKLVKAVGDFLGLISDTAKHNVKIYEQRLKLAEKSKSIKKYLELASLLEEEILGGRVLFSSQKGRENSNYQLEAPSFNQILFQTTGDNNIEVSIASSMVKELSSLVIYLRYRATYGDLIVIDEPEMNLHPQAQMKLIEFLALLINSGLRILITTHSPYLIDHLTNLMKASESEDKEVVRGLFSLKTAEAFISRDKISVYLIEEGTAKNAIDEEGVINLGTFGDVSDHIAEIYFAL